MIRQAVKEQEHSCGILLEHLTSCGTRRPEFHSIQARVYCENPSDNFKPSPGLLQLVKFPEHDWLRIDSWVETGSQISPFYDPLACKIIVVGPSREIAVDRMCAVLAECTIAGPPNNIEYLRAVVDSDDFRLGGALTTFLDAFKYTPQYEAPHRL
jgi:urea carboxylase